MRPKIKDERCDLCTVYKIERVYGADLLSTRNRTVVDGGQHSVPPQKKRRIPVGVVEVRHTYLRVTDRRRQDRSDGESQISSCRLVIADRGRILTGRTKREKTQGSAELLIYSPVHSFSQTVNGKVVVLSLDVHKPLLLLLAVGTFLPRSHE